MKKTIILFLTISMAVAITACGSEPASSASDATLAFLESLVSKDKDRVSSLVCKDWEEQAMLEVDALLSVGAVLNDVTCSQTGETGEDALVVCDGSLDLTYNDEIRAIELNSRTYTMTIEDGQWRVCSYK